MPATAQLVAARMKHTKLHIVPFALLAFGEQLQAQGEVIRLPGGTGSGIAIADLDGDGRREILIEQAPTPPAVEVRILRVTDGQVLRSHPAPPNVEYGAGLAALGDLDGDGVEDYAIAAPAATSWLPSFVEFRSGASGALLSTFVSPGLPQTLGQALARIADVDLDGVDDVLISARTRTSGSPSRVYVVSGASGAVLRTHIAGAGNGNLFGAALEGLGDVDGDGRRDYAISDTGAAEPGTLATVDVISGASGALVYRITSTVWDSAGESLANLGGDLDGDGVEDFAVGVPARFHAPFRTGGVDLRSGASGALIRSVDTGYGVMFGHAIVAPGDITGDGLPDFVASVPLTCAGACSNKGYTHFFDGATGADLGRCAFGAFGVASAVGDVNFDGRGDVLITGNVPIVALGGVRAPKSYCSPSGGSLGCYPYAIVAGSASASIGPELQLVAPNLRAQRTGLFFWGRASTAVPFGPGTMCVAAPRVRLPLSSTGGSTGCSGELRTTLSRTYLAANGLLPGSVFFAQAWARDNSSPSQPTQLSSALEVTLWP